MKYRRVSGLLLVVAGCLGFLTVADDLDHVGEIFCVGGVLMAGVALLLDGSRLLGPRRVPLYWLAAGIAVGEVAGAVVGRVPMGVSGGAILGAIASAVMLNRPDPAGDRGGRGGRFEAPVKAAVARDGPPAKKR